MEGAYIFGLMVGDMKVNGNKTTCMERESILGLMGESTMESIKMIKNMVSALICGLMGADIQDSGKMGNNMGKANMLCLTEQRGQDIGKWVNG